MTPTIINGSFIISVAVVIGQIFVVFCTLAYLIELKKENKPFTSLIIKYAFPIGLAGALGALLGSLFYSEIAGFEPCKFCWWQRIFMYPIALLLGIAAFKKDLKVWRYVMPLSILGALLSINHYILQISGTSILPCSAVGQSVACNKVFIMQFGYITIPLMAFTAFLMIFISTLALRKKDRDS